MLREKGKAGREYPKRGYWQVAAQTMDNQTMDKVSAHAPLPDRSIDALRWPQRGVSVPAVRCSAQAVRPLVVELSLFFEP